MENGLFSLYNFLYLFDFFKTISRFYFFLLKQGKKKEKGRDPKRPDELEGKSTPAGLNLSLWHTAMKLEVTDPKSSSGSLALHPRSGAWAALLEQNMGAAVLHFLSAERSEKDAALSIMSLLSIDRILSFFVCLTQ